ncbi:FAD-dependent oxidoreductase [Halomicrobium salinisoli]|uniref:FAD-dependent oxidoreductase n=1 Tax=Halomicrobium salinisoli TaxID=2878391 RepID=UPI001CF06E0F|nr:FAD-dependent oxidoreductase [Halomicrobium salinisoli]
MDDTPCRVAAVRDVGPDAVAIDVESPAEFDAAPGQFVKLTFEVDGEAESRFYTVSSPEVGDTFEITVGIDPEGTVGPILADLAPGDELTVSGPFGSDYYEGEPFAVVLAGGPGVGPAVGIAERALDEGNDAAVVYRDDDPIHGDRLDALADRGAFVRRLDADGDLDAATADALAAADADPQLFVYGFADFVDAATDAVEAAGGDAEGAKIENFG